ncbi:Transcriptional regulatory protein sin3 [Puccinia graminis f. sp. tritici]|uniref:Transcriptional regulatory protein sin3 n=1 Tax=Puccinia graminis f. sp. tritici TaxID=56615 RepID=A0A5B0RNT7_PUCGR|nr:Transcriptional regulatory protein sin3 [Puccinia graminis f. sp. tritici]
MNSITHLTPLPPERKGAENDASNPTKNFDTDGNETAYSEGDTVTLPEALKTTRVMMNDPKETVGRPSRGLSARKRGPPVKDGTSNATGNTDLRKRAMKNASSGGVICNDRASARRIESNKKISRGRPSESYLLATQQASSELHPYETNPYPQADVANGSSKMRSNAADPSSAVCQDAIAWVNSHDPLQSRATRLNEAHPHPLYQIETLKLASLKRRPGLTTPLTYKHRSRLLLDHLINIAPIRSSPSTL